jgi:hypothetical protein
MKSIKITIKEIEGHKGQFLAYCKNEFLTSTFCVYFTDTIFGSVGLNHFAEMLKHKYETDKVTFVISNEKITFRSPELLDLMMNKKRA